MKVIEVHNSGSLCDNGSFALTESLYLRLITVFFSFVVGLCRLEIT